MATQAALAEVVEDQEAVKVGTTRQAAIRNIIKFATSESWAAMQTHVAWCRGLKQSCLSDQILAYKGFWPRSPTPAKFTPSEQQEHSARAVSSLNSVVNV